MVKLLIFAHRGEAQAFFNEWEFLPVNFHFTGLFKSKDHYLLITGEGPKDASEKTVAVISAFKSEISEVINIGIAGSLTPKLKVGDHVWIRSSYAQNAKACEFKSFTTKNHTNIDCITAYSRVTTPEERNFLSSFADVVDRELWSIASAAHLFKIELSALKLISDESDSADICQLVKNEAAALSKRLFTEYQIHLKKHAVVTPITLVAPKSNTILDYILTHPKLYFTTSQTRKLTTLLRGISLKKILIDEEIKTFIQKLIESTADTVSSKELSKSLLNLLSEKLNPLNTQIKNKIADALVPLTDSGAQANFDPELEQDYIQLTYQIRSTKDQKKLILALEQFNYQKIKDIFKGEFGDDV